MSRRSRYLARRKSSNTRPLFETLEDRSLMALWVVNTLADTVDPDADVTSLREAVQQANANPGADTIDFNVAGNINISSAFPVLTDATGGTTIDGTTAPGYAGSPVVSLVGPGTASGLNGLKIESASNTIKGLQIGNFTVGIDIVGATNARIERNTIAFNGSDGIRVAGVVAGGHLFDRNSLFSNGGLGINLVSATDNAAGVTPNDLGDADSGPNGLQNFPVISSAVAQAFGTEVTFSLNSTPNTAFILQFFASPTADPSGFGEGQVYLGDYPVITNAAGNVTDVKLFSAVPVGHVITATAATPAAHNTSEFSAAVAVTSAVTTRTWTGSGRTAAWSDPANWGGTTPVAGDHLVFGPGARTTSVNDLAPGTSFGSIKFTADGFVLSGNPLKVGAGIEVTAPAGSTIEVNVDVSIANDLLPYIEQDNLLPYIEQDNVLKLSGLFTGDFGLEKLGPGTLVLSAANTYTGQTTVADGVLRLENSLALGSSALGTELTNGNLELQGGLTVAGETLHIADGTSNIRSVSGANTWTGAWHIDPICNPIVVEAGSTLTASGVLSGVGGFHKDGPGTFVLSGANTYAGVSHVEAGTLSVRSNTALGSTAGDTELLGGRLELQGGITVAGEVLAFKDASSTPEGVRSVSGANTWTGAWHIDPICPPIVVDSGSTLTASGVLSGIGGMHKDGLGTLVLSGANTYDGETHIAEGTLSVRSNTALGSSAAGTELIAGTLELAGGVNVQGESLSLLPYLEQENVVRSVSGDNTWTGTWHIDPICNPIVVAADSTLTASGVLSGVGGLHKDGPGTFVLSGANTYAGVTHIDEGTLRVQSATALGSTVGSTEVMNDGTLELAGSFTVAGETLNVEAAERTADIIAILIGAVQPVWAGQINLPLDGHIHINPIHTAAGSSLTVSGIISGGAAAGLEKVGAGTLILSGANTFSGQATVREGVISLRNNQALGSNAGNTILREGARLELEGVQIAGENLTIEPSGGFLQGELRSASGSNTWGGPIDLPQHIDPICNPIRALSGSVMRVSGVISGGTNAEVAKFGGGTLILSAANTFTGQAKATEGVLRIENSQALGTGSGATELRGGTRLELAGNLTIHENLTLVGSPPGSQFPAIDIASIGINKWEGLTAVNPETRFTVESGSLEMSGVISGNDNLEKLGPGTLILSANNTVTGTLRVFDGTLVVNGSQPQMPIEIQGGTLTGSGQVGPVTVVGETENVLIMQADPLHPGEQSLLVIGSDGDDQIRFTRAGQTGIEVVVNSVSRGVFHPTSRLEVHGGDGDDDIQLAGNIDLPAWLYGDDGDDRLKGGRGDDVLLGGAGNDRIAGRQGRDLVIGGRGADRLLGRGDEDILIAGYTSFDNNQAALNSIMAEWTRTNLNYSRRVEHLQTGGGLNGGVLLKATGSQRTVFDDGAVDRLSGNADRDWYFAQLTGPGVRDIITDNHGNEDEEDL